MSLNFTGFQVLNPIRLTVVIATLCVSLPLVMANHVLVPTLETKDLKSEFLKSAPQAWMQQREKYFNNRAWKTLHKTSNPSPESAEVFMKTIVYSAAPLFCEEKEVATAEKSISTQVVGGNSQYAFSLARESDLAWRLSGTEILDERIGGFQLADLDMNRPREKQPARSIRIVFSRAEFLSVSGQPVEKFFENVKDSIIAVDEKSDPDLGRLVKVVFDHIGESTKRASSNVESRRVFGTITFIPDKLWSIYESDLNYESHGQDGEVINESTSKMVFSYSGGSNIPRSVKLVSKSSAGAVTESVVEIEELSHQEISALRKKCYLSGFELPEPPGVSWGWPRWVYFVLVIGCIGLVGIVFVYFKRRGQ